MQQTTFVIQLLLKMTYIGVLFEEAAGGGLAVINKSWLTPRKQEVFWPPYKTQDQYDKALRRGETPVEDSWKLYSISRLFFECDDFDKAKAKLKKAELTSDIQTDEEDDLIKNTKRQRIAPKRLYDSSSDEEVCQDVAVGRSNKRNQNLPRPPIVKTSDNVYLEQHFTERSPDESGFCLDRGSDLEERLIARHPPTVKIVKNVIARSSESSTCSSVLLEEGSTPKRDITKVSSTRSTASPIPSPAGSFVSSVSENKRMENKLLDLLLHIKEQNNIIISCLNKKTCSLTTNNILDFPVEFPLENNDDVETLESYLKHQDSLTNLSSYFASLGGRDTVSRVNKILKRCFSNSLATEYSFYGKRQNKKPFNNLNLKNVILNAVKVGDPGATEQDTEDAIKVWLKHAPQRLKLEKKNNRSKN